jgi:sugar/nucleoside kinase (ribokinase family)
LKLNYSPLLDFHDAFRVLDSAQKQSRTKHKMPVITVIGSLNTDMVTVTSRVPDAGETIKAKSFDVGWGGKGGNQCVAAARLSRESKSVNDSYVEVRMIGAVGDDVFGPQLLKCMDDDGINVQGVRTVKGQKTGTAVILVEESTGENRILFTPGANFALTVSDELVADNEYGDVALFQLETPLDVVGPTHRLCPVLNSTNRIRSSTISKKRKLVELKLYSTLLLQQSCQIRCTQKSRISF